MTRWFRVYDDIVDDPKVQQLSAKNFRALINLWSLASQNGGALPSENDIAFRLRMKPSEAAKVLACLEQAGLIDKTNQGLVPHNWGSRQYKSDTSKERTQRYRERKRDAQCDVTGDVTCDGFDSVSVSVSVLNNKNDSSLRDESPPAAASDEIVIDDVQPVDSDQTATGREHVADTSPTHQEHRYDAAANEIVVEAEPVYTDAKHELWTEGRLILESMGLTNAKAGSMIGRWLKDTKEDYATVLDAIKRARDARTGDPIAWITAAIPTKIGSRAGPKPDPVLEGIKRAHDHSFGPAESAQ